MRVSKTMPCLGKLFKLWQAITVLVTFSISFFYPGCVLGRSKDRWSVLLKGTAPFAADSSSLAEHRVYLQDLQQE